MDDGVTGGFEAEVEKMRGVKLGKGEYSGTIPKILNRGNLAVKAILCSGDTDEEDKNLIGNKVLGYGWDATSDEMSVNIHIYLQNKKKNEKGRSIPPLSVDDLKSIDSSKLTRRICLGIVNGLYDPLGLACPFVLTPFLTCRRCMG